MRTTYPIGQKEIISIKPIRNGERLILASETLECNTFTVLSQLETWFAQLVKRKITSIIEPIRDSERPILVSETLGCNIFIALSELAGQMSIWW